MKKVSELQYTRVNADEVIAAIEKCTRDAKAAKSGKALAACREEALKHIFRVSTMSALAFMRFTLDTRAPFYLGEKDYYDEEGPKIDSAYVKFQRAFLQNPHSKETAPFLNPLVLRHYEQQITCTSDEVIPFKIEENKLVTEYTKLMAETTFPWDNENLPLSKLKKYFADADRSVRQKAYTVLGETLATIGDTLDSLYDRMVKVRHATAVKLGFNNYVELGDRLMGRISYDRQQLAAFRKNVLSSVVPVLSRLKQKAAASLGISDFMLYDNESYFACGNPTPVLDAKAMFEAGKAMYRDMSKETGAFFDFMLETDAFDVFSREGKWGGGYCTSFADYKQPFILANFNGTSGDVDVLTHEAGHALADYMMYQQNHDQELSVGGMETAETHSMSMEFFCHKYMDKFFGERAQDYRYMHLFDALTFLPYGTIVDYFQELVYTHPDMTPKERNELWNKLEHEFRPWLSTEGIPYLEKGTRWQYQMHIFENPLYYIDYCLAQSVALQFYFKSREDYPAAFRAYMDFLKCGGTVEFPKLVQNAGLVSPFEDGALKTLAENAERLLDSFK